MQISCLISMAVLFQLLLAWYVSVIQKAAVSGVQW